MKHPKQETTEPITPMAHENVDATPDATRAWSDERKRLEGRIGGKLIDLPALKGLGYGELADSLERLGRFVNVERSLLIADTSKEDRIRIRFYTNRNVYFISAILGAHWQMMSEPSRPKMKDDGYLSGSVTCRTPEAGEWWNRGRDLASGSYSRETFEHILLDIIGFEIEPLADWITKV